MDGADTLRVSREVFVDTWLLRGRDHIMHYFDELGSAVGQLWKHRNYDYRLFPEVAQAAFSELPPNQHTCLEDAVQFGLTKDPLPYQQDISAHFGQPPLTVYLGRDFRIEVLFWINSTPSIHQHAFSGAFFVLLGSSLHLSWAFETEQRINTHLLYGDVLLKQAEILPVGTFRPIVAGDDFIHTTFHLERPTISVVIRTLNEEDRRPQYAYLPPTICWDPHERLLSLRRREQLLGMLIYSDRMSEYQRMMDTLLDTSDTYAAFRYLLHAAYAIKKKDAFDDLLVRAAKRHSCLIEKLSPALSYLRRQNLIVQLREKAATPDLRFFLSLLANLTDKASVLQLLKQTYTSQDPVAVFVNAMSELSAQNLLTSHFNDAWLLMLECLLRGVSDWGEINDIFKRKYGIEQVHAQEATLNTLALKLAEFWLVRPYLPSVCSLAAERVASPLDRDDLSFSWRP